MEKYKIKAELEDQGKRVDLFLKENLPQYSRSQIQKWIKRGSIHSDYGAVVPSTYIKKGDILHVVVTQEEVGITPENIPLKILYEDTSILVVDKPAGMVTHPGVGNLNGTLANALAHRLGANASRVGIVHRLDKDTSGVMVVAKTSFALAKLTESFKERKVKKVYRAIVCGNMDVSKGEIEGSIARAYRSIKMEIKSSGKFARTDFKVLKRYPKHTHVEVYPKTGRTHQIRLHLSQIGYPILGDKTYGKESQEVPRQMLHAYTLTIPHPTNKRWVTFKAPIPIDFRDALGTVT